MELDSPQELLDKVWSPAQTKFSFPSTLSLRGDCITSRKRIFRCVVAPSPTQIKKSSTTSASSEEYLPIEKP
jgi:hypothetical protein